MASVRVWVKKRLVVGHLNIQQRQMFTLGTVGLAAVKNRLAAAQGPNDGPAKPLSKGYAIRKTRLGLGNRRTLSFTGNMLRNLSIRTVSENRATAGLTSRKDRQKARANHRIEPWLVFSRANAAAVIEGARRMLADPAFKKRLLMERFLGK